MTPDLVSDVLPFGRLWYGEPNAISIAIALAERMVREALAKARWREVDLASRPKGHHVKVKIAQQLRRQTPMSRQWIADRLRIGSASYVSNLLSCVDSEL
jgi:hypothetical protein